MKFTKTKAFKFVIILLLAELLLGINFLISFVDGLSESGWGDAQTFSLILFGGYSVILILGALIIGCIRVKTRERNSLPVTEGASQKAAELLPLLSSQVGSIAKCEFEYKLKLGIYSGMLKRISAGRRIDVSYKADFIDVLPEYVSTEGDGYFAELYALLSANVSE